MRYLFAAIGLALQLSGCQNSAQIAAAEQARWDQMLAEQKMRFEQNKNTCALYGFTPEKPGFAECMRREEARRQETERLRQAVDQSQRALDQSRVDLLRSIWPSP